jgi:heat shock protein HtpX
VRKTWFLMTLMFVLIIALGWLFSYLYNSPSILIFAVIFSIVLNLVSYWYSDKIALAFARAKPAEKSEYPELYKIVENLAITAGIPNPKIYIIPDTSPNAFATGRNKNNAAIAVTLGLLQIMDKKELEGVIAHEIAHIQNKDILLSTVVVILVGIISLLADLFLRISFFSGRGKSDENKNSNLLFIIGIIGVILAPIAASLIQLAISRKREFLADASGALLTRYPEGLASALEKIAQYPNPLQNANSATAHMYFANPFKADVKIKKTPFLVKIFMTHPPVEERIAKLRSLDI